MGKTKLLKILFLLEENSIKKYGTPFFGLDFKVWQFGPVVAPIYSEIHEDQINLFKEYFAKNEIEYFIGLKDFNDDEFSNNDVLLMDEMVDFARHKVAKNFVNFTHAKDSLWRRAAQQLGILQELETGEIKTTDFSIDFAMLFNGKDDIHLLDKYRDAMEARAFSKNFKELRGV